MWYLRKIPTVSKKTPTVLKKTPTVLKLNSKLAFQLKRTNCRRTSGRISLRTCRPLPKNVIFLKTHHFRKYVLRPIWQDRVRWKCSLTLRTSKPGSRVWSSSKHELTVFRHWAYLIFPISFTFNFLERLVDQGSRAIQNNSRLDQCFADLHTTATRRCDSIGKFSRQ